MSITERPPRPGVRSSRARNGGGRQARGDWPKFLAVGRRGYLSDRRRRGQRRVVAIPIASRWQSWTPSSSVGANDDRVVLPLLKRYRDHRMGTGAVATRDGARELVAAIWLRGRRKADPLVAHWGTGALSIMSNPTPASAEGHRCRPDDPFELPSHPHRSEAWAVINGPLNANGCADPPEVVAGGVREVGDRLVDRLAGGRDR